MKHTFSNAVLFGRDRCAYAVIFCRFARRLVFGIIQASRFGKGNIFAQTDLQVAAFAVAVVLFNH